jgi:hypothetical protein
MWYAGSTDTFSFADDPDRPKGIVVLDTETARVEHVGLTGQRPLVTLDTVHALGLSPSEVSDLVLQRAAAVPDGAVARLYVDGVDPEAWRLLDLEAVRALSGNALLLKLEPTFAGVHANAELPDLDSMPARWSKYLENQDLTGYDRPRLEQLGLEYLSRAVEGSC